MSVLIKSLGNGDALIMTTCLTCYLSDIVYLSVNTYGGSYVFTHKLVIYLNEDLVEVSQKLLQLGLLYEGVSVLNNKLKQGTIFIPKVNVKLAVRETILK